MRSNVSTNGPTSLSIAHRPLLAHTLCDSCMASPYPTRRPVAPVCRVAELDLNQMWPHLSRTLVGPFVTSLNCQVSTTCHLTSDHTRFRFAHVQVDPKGRDHSAATRWLRHMTLAERVAPFGTIRPTPIAKGSTPPESDSSEVVCHFVVLSSFNHL